MGCASSVVSPEGEVQMQKENISEKSKTSPEHKKHLESRGYQNGHVKASQTYDYSNYKKNQNVDKNANKVDPYAQAPVPKSVAFDVTLDGQSGDGLLLVKKRPPKLQTLEPLNVPRLTAEQLEEKQRLADEKREKLKQKKINTSQKSFRRRRELLKAREFGMKQQMEQEKSVIDDSLKQAEMKREQRLMEIKEKQKLREERARRARERAKRIQNPDEEVEVEKDDQFNAASDDSWLAVPEPSDPNNQGDAGDEEQGLQKKVGQARPTASASTVDSYDAAFMRHRTDDRQPLTTVHNQQSYAHDMNDDDFFGS